MQYGFSLYSPLSGHFASVTGELRLEASSVLCIHLSSRLCVHVSSRLCIHPSSSFCPSIDQSMRRGPLVDLQCVSTMPCSGCYCRDGTIAVVQIQTGSLLCSSKALQRVDIRAAPALALCGSNDSVAVLAWPDRMVVFEVPWSTQTVDILFTFNVEQARHFSRAGLDEVPC